MTITQRLTIARDLWWMIPSGIGGYITNQAGQLSSWNNTIYKNIDEDLGASDSTYLQNNTDTESSYYFKTEHNTVVPDQVQVKIRAKNGDGSGTTVKVKVYINGLELGDVGTFGASITDVTQNFTLTDSQRKAIIDSRIDGMYDHFRYFITTDDLIPNSALRYLRIYATEIRYISNKDEQYVNYNDQNNEDITYLYPTGLRANRQTWQTDAGVTITSSDFSLIDEPPSGVDADTRYIRTISDGQLIGSSEATNGTNSIGYNRNYLMPSGFLSLYFNNSLPAMERINRATLSLRMSLPPSGLGGNVRDAFTVEGFNPTMASGVGSQVMWGAGSIVEQSGFKNYDVDLCWLDPSLRTVTALSGNVQSQYYKNTDSFKNLELRLRGVPSGAYLSAAELKLEYIPSLLMPLHTIGGNLAFETVSRTPNASASGYHFIGSFPGGSGMDHLFNQGYWRFAEASGSVFFSEYGTISGYMQDGTLAGAVADRRNFYKQKTHEILHDRWKNGIKLNNGGGGGRFRVIRFSSSPVIPSGFTVFGHISPLSGTMYRTATTYITGKISPTQNDFFIQTTSASDNITAVSYNGVGTTTSIAVPVTNPSSNIMFAYTYNHSTSGIGFYVYNPTTRTIASGAGTAAIRHTTGSNFRVGAASTDTSTGGVPTTNFYGFIHELAVGQQPLNSSQIADLFFSRETGYGNYLDVANTGTFLQWKINVGSGNAYNETSLGLPSLITATDSRFNHIDGPYTTSYGNNIVVPSAVRVRMEVDNKTSHPSGAYIKPTVIINAGGTQNYYIGETLVPSGAKSFIIPTVLSQSNNSVTSGNYTSDMMILAVRFDHGITSDYTTDLRIYSAEALVDTYSTPVAPVDSGSSNSNFTLHTFSSLSSNSGLSLYTLSTASNNSGIPLYTVNASSSNSGIPLFMQVSPIDSSGISLYTGGFSSSNSGLSAYIIGGYTISSGIDLYTNSLATETGNMRLVINGTDPPNSSGNVYLYTRSTSTPSLFSTSDLFLKGATIDNRGELPLYMAGPIASSNSYLPMYIRSDYAVASSGLNMTLFNERSGVSKSMNLYLEGNDYIMSSSTMPLYMSRDYEGVWEVAPLFMKVNDEESSEFTMYVMGAIPNSSQITIHMSGRDIKNNIMPLFTHGF